MSRSVCDPATFLFMRCESQLSQIPEPSHAYSVRGLRGLRPADPLPMPQRGGRVSAQVPADVLDRVHRLHAVRGQRLRLRPRGGLDPRVQGRARDDGPGALGHDVLPGVGILPRPVHRPVQLDRHRLLNRRARRRGPRERPHNRVPRDLGVHRAVLDPKSVHHLRLLNADAHGRGVRAHVRHPRIRAGLHPGGLPRGQLRHPGHDAIESLHGGAGHGTEVRSWRWPGHDHGPHGAARGSVLDRVGLDPGRVLLPRSAPPSG